MQKYRVACPHCEANLLVTEDLLGQPGQCPGCQMDFLLPTADAFAIYASSPAPPLPTPAQRPESEPVRTDPRPQAESFVPPALEESPVLNPPQQAGGRTQAKPVKIVVRPSIIILSTLLKAVAALQLVTGCILLLVLMLMSFNFTVPPFTIVLTVGAAICIGASAIPMLAFAELLHVWTAQEEMLRHILNHLRGKD